MATTRPLIIFDVDGTLIRNTELLDRCYIQAVRECLCPEDPQSVPIDTTWTSYRYVTDPGILGEIIQQFDAEIAPNIERQVHDRYLHLLAAGFEAQPAACAEVPGAGAMLRRLLEEDVFALTIATGSWQATIDLKMTHAGLDVSDFPMATASDGASREAIVGAAIDRARSRWAIDRGCAVSVGDGVWDVHTARRMDLAFLGIGTGAEAEALEQAGTGPIFPDWTDQEAVLAAISRELDRLGCGS